MASDTPIMSSVDLWPLDWAPQGWASCDGATLSISQFSALYSLLGVTYGGNGTTNFCLPDLRGRVAIGKGGSYNVGYKAGAESVALTVNNLPSHNHSATATATVTPSASTGTGKGGGSSLDPAGRYPLKLSTGTPIYGTPADIQMGQLPAGAATVSVTVSPAGSGQPVSVMQPYLVLHYIIALEGTYPMRP